MSRVGPLEPTPIALRPPRSLTDLLWVANTRHGPGGHWFARPAADDADHDHLATASEASRYLSDHRVVVPPVKPSRDHLRSLAIVRDMVRALVEPGPGWTADATEILGAARFRIDAELTLSATASGWEAFIDDLMLPLLQLVGLRDRLRACSNPACRLMFLDLSKNRGRRWCDNGGCGNRVRVRRYRSRTKDRQVAATAHTSPPGDQRPRLSQMRGA
jgi:predicted RNA-binding Zn ribbon-like protein